MKKFPRALFTLPLIWLVVLCVPSLRLLCSVQVTGSDVLRFSVLPARETSTSFWQDAARRFPNDPRIAVQIIESNGTALSPASAAILRDYDALIEKHPDELWLLARRLCLTIEHYKMNRVGGEFSDAKLSENLAAGKPSPERDKTPPNFSSQDLDKTLALCRRGQKLDPGNAFFDWTRAYFAGRGWRDKEAWQALASGARKRSWNDYDLEYRQGAVAAHELAWGRSLLGREKSEWVFNRAFGIHSRWREFARVVSWEATKAKRRGNHARALRLWGSMARIMRLVRNNGTTYINGLVAIAIEAIAYGNATYDPRRSAPNIAPNLRRRLTPQQRVKGFSDYASQHGRPDLAREAAQAWTARTNYLNKVSARTLSDYFGGLSIWQMAAISWLWDAGVILLLLLPIALFIFLVTGVIEKWPRLRKVLRLDAQDEPITRKEIIGGALACSGLRASGSTLLLAITLALSLAPLLIAEDKFQGWWNNTTPWWRGLWEGFAKGNTPDLSWLDSILTGGLSQSESPAQWRWIIALAPPLWGLLHATWRATVRQRTQAGEKPPQFHEWMKTVVTGRVFSSPIRFDLVGAAVAAAKVMIYSLLFLTWIAIAF